MEVNYHKKVKALGGSRIFSPYLEPDDHSEVGKKLLESLRKVSEQGEVVAEMESGGLQGGDGTHP